MVPEGSIQTFKGGRKQPTVLPRNNNDEKNNKCMACKRQGKVVAACIGYSQQLSSCNKTCSTRRKQCLVLETYSHKAGIVIDLKGEPTIP